MFGRDQSFIFPHQVDLQHVSVATAHMLSADVKAAVFKTFYKADIISEKRIMVS